MNSEFEILCSKYNLENYIEKLKNKSLSAVKLIPKVTPEEKISIGDSKLGGKPDLPSKNFIWPTYKEKPLSFIAQINLEKLPNFESRQSLPKAGLLSFFYNNVAAGFDPKDRGAFKVFYFSGDLQLERTLPPVLPKKKYFFGLFELDDNFIEYKTCQLEAVEFRCLPNDYELIPIPAELSDDYYELLESLGGHHRLLAYAEPIQADMELECEMVSHSFYCGDGNAYRDPRVKELSESSKNWQLLLQVDSETQYSNMMWGDAGRLYFWIKKDDLLARAFENVWLISQCY